MQPDLIVLEPDAPHVALVAEIRRDLPDRSVLTAQLRAYMLDNRCGVALLVTPSKTWIYRDTLHDFTEDSIHEVGEFDTAEVLGLPEAPKTEAELLIAAAKRSLGTVEMRLGNFDRSEKLLKDVLETTGKFTSDD